jgi:tight adherence protein B
MKIHALTSEARASSIIIGALPFLVTGAIAFINPTYLKPLFMEEGGQQALMVAVGMLGFGVWVMGRMAKFEI